MSSLKPTRTIKLQCPLMSSKTIETVVMEDERVDLGSVARAFGLDPHTVRLNGRFISRGVDFVACSVTWKSLLSFFAAKALVDRPILVHGNPSKLGTKRACDSSVNGNINGRSTMEDTELVNNKKRARNGDSGENGGDCQISTPGFKRKLLLEDLSLLKRLRINETNDCVTDHKDLSSDNLAKAKNGVSKTVSSTSLLRCSPNSATKRMRNNNLDEAVLTAPYKRVR